MHHYDFHIGDYMKATAHLSNEEDLCYRRLLDMYYDTEQPIPLETQWVSRRLRVGSEIIQSVLNDFFIKCDDGWHSPRCDDEIAKYNARAHTSQTNGKLGGRPKKTQQVSEKSQPLNFETLTSNQEPISKPPISPKGDDVRFVAFWSSYPRKQGKGAAAKAWTKAKINGEFDSVMQALEAQKSSDQWRKDNGQFIPNPATWINQRRWEDEIPGGSHSDGTSSMIGGAGVSLAIV